MTTEEQKRLNEKLYWAVDDDDVNNVKKYLEQGADPYWENTCTTALSAACKIRDKTTLKHMVNYQGDVNKKSDAGRLDVYESGRYWLLRSERYYFNYDPYDD